MKNLKNSQSGMTLIEIMVSFMIVTGAFIAILQAFPLGLSINKRAESGSIASYLAQQKIEEIWSQGYDNIATGTLESRHRISSDVNDYLYHFERSAVVEYVDGSLSATSSDDGLKKISSTVYYIDALSKSEKNYTITTLISQR